MDYLSLSLWIPTKRHLIQVMMANFDWLFRLPIGCIRLDSVWTTVGSVFLGARPWPTGAIRDLSLSLSLSLSVSLCLSLSPSLSLPLPLSLPLSRSVSVSVSLCLCLSVCLSVCVSVSVSVCLSLSLSKCIDLTWPSDTEQFCPHIYVVAPRICMTVN